GAGYLYCLNVLERQSKDVWLVNQHVEPTLRFSSEQFGRMRTELLKRMEILKELDPWPDLNYAIEESWAVIDPYGSEVRSGENVNLRVRILNHAPRPEIYRVSWNLPADWKVVHADREVMIPKHGEGAARAIITVQGVGLHVVTADVEFDGR